jgi:hypothetical protein
MTPDERAKLYEMARRNNQVAMPGSWVCELLVSLDAAEVEVDRLRTDKQRLLALLAEFVDDRNPCEFDHNGECQMHGFFGLQESGGMCPNAQALAIINTRST